MFHRKIFVVRLFMVVVSALFAIDFAFAQDTSPVQLEKYKPPIKLACVGDSITAGFGAGRGGSWPDQIRKVLGEGWEVKNFGVSGTTLMKSGDSPYQKQGAFKAAKDFQPNVVVIMLGTNDTKPQNWKNFEKDFAADYKDMVQQFSELPTKPRVFICRPPYIAQGGSFGINEPNTLAEIPVVDKIAQEMKLGIVDVHEALKGKDALIPDKVHPNAKGQAEIAKAVLKSLTGYDGEFPPVAVVLATSEKNGASWRYTTDKPGSEWIKPDFDASKWKEGVAGFGSPVAPQGSARTEWKTDDIWMRREFTLEEKKLNHPRLRLRHDDDAEVYLNGVLAANAAAWNEEYQEFEIRPEAAAALKPGKNVIAIHCHQNSGGQYVDAGIVDALPVGAGAKK